MRIIPAIDLIDGKCVRLRQGDFGQKTTYTDSPLKVAKDFAKAGISNLHLVDLDGAKAGATVHWDILRSIADETALKIDFGGGIKTMADVERAFALGANQVVLGSVGVENPDQVGEWGREFGHDRFVLAADVRGSAIAKGGWMESGNMDIAEYLSHFRKEGFSYFLCTDIARDGMLTGPSLALYASILDRFSGIKLIASGGIRSVQDLSKLRVMGLEGAVIGVAIYEGKITTEELSNLC